MTERPDANGAALLTAAAAGLIGCAFRLHGRDPATGLDCVGLVASALKAAGAQAQVPEGYSLRNLTIDHWLHCAAGSGLRASPGQVCAGDIVLLRLDHCQHHLMIAESATSVIHAHAGLRQVVRQPFDPRWQVCAKWRLASSKGT